MDALTIVVGVWITFESSIALWMLIDYKIKPWLHKGKGLELPESGISVIMDARLYDGKKYVGEYKDANLTRLADQFINKITGALPKRDFNSRLKDAIETVADEAIVDVIKSRVDKDMLVKYVDERMGKAMQEYFKE